MLLLKSEGQEKLFARVHVQGMLGSLLRRAFAIGDVINTKVIASKDSLVYSCVCLVVTVYCLARGLKWESEHEVLEFDLVGIPSVLSRYANFHQFLKLTNAFSSRVPKTPV
ncbi:hypothetical protein AVEN_211338-1 [Araneus ventricosus]|uniref:Uncharacterized protein n=1 Tax=Araneus ventricosus TaxID=182803 RepID=A0A4Y2M6H5_ARAVE|nr:hypothetical protein AVEN_211338-1 [Araneus ventricosus]